MREDVFLFIYLIFIGKLHVRLEGLELMTLPSIPLLWEEEVLVELLFIGTRKDIICNQDIFIKIGVVSIDEKMREIAWDGLVMCRGEQLMH